MTRGNSPYDARSEGTGGSRIPPQAVEVERAVLGAMLIDKEAAPKALEVLDATSFYNPTHAKIFKAMMSLFERGDPIDAVTVVEELRRQGALQSAEDPVTITDLTMNVTSSANIEYHARIVLEKALMRSLITASSEVATRAYSDTEDAMDLLDEAESKIFQISDRRLKKSFTPIKKAVFETFEMLEGLHGKHSGITGVPTGFPKLDELTGGFQNSDLIIVAGRPSQGKTAFALSVARNAALHKEKKTAVAIFSLEMSEQQLVIRLLSSEAKVNAHLLRTGKLDNNEWAKLSRNAGRLSEAKVFIDDSASLSILELRAKARRLKAEHNIGLIVVDYLQLVQGPKNSESREREISTISRSLKALAKELNVPVVALSQLNRAVESRTDRQPMLADLRECVTGETIVMLADGRRVPIRELVGQTPRVLTMTGDHRIDAALSDKVWYAGIKPVFHIRLSSGRSIKATLKHRLYAIDGWRTVADLAPGNQLAIAKQALQPAEHAEHRSENGLALPNGAVAPDNSELAASDMFWDTIVSIDAAGEEEVFDLTVPETSSWLADGIVSHNSGAIEQDADVVMFVHRPETYKIATIHDDDMGQIPSEGIAEIIIGKQRNGPTGIVRLAFKKEYAGFERLAPMGFEAYLPPPPQALESEAPF